MVLPLNGFGADNFKLICGQFLLANRAPICIIAGNIIYMGIEKNSVDSPAHYFAIIACIF